MANLLSSGFTKVAQNKRYLFWFWVLNLTLAEFGTAAFRRGTHAILDRSLYADGLVKSFDLGVLIELLSKPEFGTLKSMTYPSLYFGFVFFLATALFLPGIFTGYASTYRLPREEFFRACGRNLWRFIRIMIIAGVIMGVLAALLFAANDAIAKKAEESTNEKLPFELQMIGLAVIFLIMATLRIWFDLAEVDTVLNDQRAVRKSIAAALRHTFRNLVRLLASYVVVTVIAGIVLLAGLWIWMKFIAPENVLGAFVVAQITLFLLLIPRFWQRGIAVLYWQDRMLVPFGQSAIMEPSPVPVSAPVDQPAAEAPPLATTPPIEP
ncbi:MAG TPA: hypothetical protein VMG82_27305 [Candidatus Sulfotelmatobacter sp.]|nr:hypothetical protein [Candidatus Sulfotelmatobacter sp.]